MIKLQLKNLKEIKGRNLRNFCMKVPYNRRFKSEYTAYGDEMIRSNYIDYLMTHRSFAPHVQ